MNDIVRRDPRAEWIARNRLHPLHAAMQSAQGGEVRWMGPHGVIRKNPHAVGFLGPNGIRRIDRSGGQQGSGVRRASVAQEAQLPLHVVEQPAFLVAVVPDMVGGRLSSHDKDLLGLARKLAGNDGAVLAVVFGEHKESAFDSAGVDRLLHLSGGEYDGYAPEQRILALRNLENQLAPRHWLFPDSRNGGGELGRRLAAALGER
ncbi:TPA: electron transfer flavoprotein subunit alpha/FixB family protein, partial [Pseudomonas aeruginosa]|nr:electron transfer flavoprotein subunit alpha/FixB family protein [Pseudomonas aeruginosa]HCI1754639.1 electron transfer flavoprotein subunit alpha/FixB family protein [Pseudomonas aeruginosa]HEJ6251128.1 electron transfer flavoprotein subunit alpha/FixB family protein [Pseudomonas aeruginosa]HEJ6270100.1 electron transfer flavoprotein subunit alpha/FixB family protein [Pseudomonas aeruginosa]